MGIDIEVKRVVMKIFDKKKASLSHRTSRPIEDKD